MERTECIIVGGGIGGAVLALLLAKKGRQVLVLEREKTPPISGRPEILERATVETFRSLGIGQRILDEAAKPLNGLELSDVQGRVLMRISAQEIRSADARVYSTDPCLVREILLEHASRAGAVEIRRGVEVTGLTRENGRVSGVACRVDGAETFFSSAFVVGDDGSHSKIRSSLGIPIRLSEFPLKFLVPKHFLPAADAQGRGLARLDLAAVKNGIVGGIFMPLSNDRTAFVYVLTKSAYERFTREPSLFARQAPSLTPAGLVEAVARHFQFPGDFILLDRPFGHAQRYTADGAALLGDAAHPVTPAGGQGANMSVADAVELAAQWDDTRRYEALRRGANARSLKFSSRAAAVFGALGLFPWLAPALTGLLSRTTPAMKQRLLRSLATSFLT